MLGYREKLALIGAAHFVEAVAVEVGAVKNRNTRLCPGFCFLTGEDLAIDVQHCGFHESLSVSFWPVPIRYVSLPAIIILCWKRILHYYRPPILHDWKTACGWSPWDLRKGRSMSWSACSPPWASCRRAGSRPRSKRSIQPPTS